MLYDIHTSGGNGEKRHHAGHGIECVLPPGASVGDRAGSKGVRLARCQMLAELGDVRVGFFQVTVQLPLSRGGVVSLKCHEHTVEMVYMQPKVFRVPL